MKFKGIAAFGFICLLILPLQAQETPVRSEAERLQKLENAVRQLQQRIDLTTGATTTVSTSNRTQFSATDIFINWHGIPEMNVKVGQWKAPFGLENLTPDTLIYTIERSLPTGAIVPERQIGAMIWGKPLATAS